MIKGVNKKVLEINNPQSLYFEKAVLYLKPNMTNIPYKLMKHEAHELIRSLSPKPPKYTIFLKSSLIISALLAAIAGSWIIFSVFIK